MCSFLTSLLICLFLVGLEDRIEHALLGLDLLVSHVLNGACSLSERLLGALGFLVEMHLGLPSVHALLTLIEDHLKFQ